MTCSIGQRFHKAFAYVSLDKNDPFVGPRFLESISEFLDHVEIDSEIIAENRHPEAMLRPLFQ